MTNFSYSEECDKDGNILYIDGQPEESDRIRKRREEVLQAGPHLTWRSPRQGD